MKKKILIYGFSRYLKFERNPSQKLVMDLGRRSLGGKEIISKIFKVSYAEIRAQIPQIQRRGPFDAVVGFGLAPGSHHIRLEETALNQCQSPKPDQDGKILKKRIIVKNGPKKYRANLNLSNMQKILLKNNIPVERSQDPGGYLCNYSYYLMFHHLNLNGFSAPCLFVHIPFSSELVCRYKLEFASLPEEMLFKAGGIIIDHIVKT